MHDEFRSQKKPGAITGGPGFMGTRLAAPLSYPNFVGLRPEALRPCLSEGLPSGNGSLLDLLIGRTGPGLEPQDALVLFFIYLAVIMLD
jgi:hypothetical protein